MLIAYNGCDENNLSYKACQYEQKIFNTSSIAINNNLSRAFDFPLLCLICG